MIIHFARYNNTTYTDGEPWLRDVGFFSRLRCCNHSYKQVIGNLPLLEEGLFAPAYLGEMPLCSMLVARSSKTRAGLKPVTTATSLARVSKLASPHVLVKHTLIPWAPTCHWPVRGSSTPNSIDFPVRFKGTSSWLVGACGPPLNWRVL